MPRKDTEPYEQLISQEEVELARKVRECGERNDKKRNRLRYQKPLERRPEGPFSDYAEPVPDLSSDPSHGESLVQKLIDLLISDPRRVMMAFAVTFLLVNAAAGRGWYPIFGLSPYASAASVTEVKVVLLKKDIFDFRVRQCSADTTDSKQFYAQKLSELLTAYKAEAGSEYQGLPTCKELGVGEP